MLPLVGASLIGLALASLPPGPGPFSQTYLPQPVPGAQRGVLPDGWKTGKLCDVTQDPYNAVGDGLSNSTDAIRAAIEACGDLTEGGTVLFPKDSGVFLTASLWLRSNLTLRVEKGATLKGTTLEGDAPMTYARRECIMMDAHAGIINGARCLRKKSPLVGWDDCAEWNTLSNVVLEGKGTIDADAEHWLNPNQGRTRPMMLDLMWIDGLTIRDLRIRKPGFWTVHPTFCNNVVVTGLDVLTRGKNTDGIDPDSSWNVYIAHNKFDTGDDCVAIKSGRDWSGLMVNISTQNVLLEDNDFYQGHGVSIGSETSGWVRNVTIRNSICNGTNTGVRLKSCRGRGGGIENILYDGMIGSVTSDAVQLTLNYQQVDPTNVTATPTLRNVVVRNLNLQAGNFLTCEGLSDSVIEGVVFENVTVTGTSKQQCSECSGSATATTPKPCF